MTIRSDLPRTRDLPIPDDTPVDGSWSPNMVEISEVIGPAPTLRLCAELGGSVIIVPRTPNQGSDISRILGIRIARRFAKDFGGERLYVPLGHSALLRARARPLMKRIAAGALSVSDAALTLDCKRADLVKLIGDDQLGRKLPPPAKRRADRQLDIFSD